MPNNRNRSRTRTHTIGQGHVQGRSRSKSRSREPPPGSGRPNVMGGYKATLQNPDASDEERQHAREMLDKYFAKYESAEGGS